jgi:hypothetical protein
MKNLILLMVALVCASFRSDAAIPSLMNPAYYLNGTWHGASVLGDYEKNTWTIRIQNYMRQVQLQSPQGGWTVTQTATLRANGTYQYSSAVVSSGPTQYSTNYENRGHDMEYKERSHATPDSSERFILSVQGKGGMVD